ncbi:MAG: DUF308 domain-containing protein [Rubripirellula sp.]|nr:DUF308 domain-containing protein [Rubripirellula sp.]
MNKQQRFTFSKALNAAAMIRWTGMTVVAFCLTAVAPTLAQESDQASINSSIGSDGTGTIVVEARGKLPEPPVFYTATANTTATINMKQIDQVVQLKAKVIQGNAKTLSFGIRGAGQVIKVDGKSLQSWAVRQVGSERYLDLQLKADVAEIEATITLRTNTIRLPATVDLTHLTPGDSIGYTSSVHLRFAPEVDGRVTKVNGFSPLESKNSQTHFQTATGGQIQLALNRSGAAPAPVEFTETTLTGDLHTNGKSVDFQLRAFAIVAEANAEITILSGNAAVSEIPADTNYRVQLTKVGKGSVYKLVFPEPGSFPVTLDFVAALSQGEANEQSMDFSVATSAVVPLTINGLKPEIEFHRDQQSVVPLLENQSWIGFLPATGRANLKWKPARQAGEGKLFFTTTGQVEAQLGAGLLRQNHRINYQVLQGELKSLSISLKGPGEILDVQGNNLVAWKVIDQGEDRQLDVTLSQPITNASQLIVRSQTPLGAFPARVDGLRLNPIGTIRHSGFLRLSNLGSVRLEPTGLSGLAQLSPEQFPADAIEARQVFVYRFPAANHSFTIAADRIQPEINISEIVSYQVAETDRVIQTDIELDIREAPIREWDLGIPADYSIVSVSGANVADYIAATEINDGRRNLKLMFGQDVAGRQLVTIHLEKSEPTAAEKWVLPRIEFPNAKTVRGDIGIVGQAGFRMAVTETELLVEKPLSYFPKPTTGLQHAFRIRDPNWSATIQIELLERSIQSDIFHLYSLSEETVYGSSLINYSVTGAPVNEWRINVPATLDNVMVDGLDVRTWRREGDTLIVSLHQPVMGGYTLLVTFEEKPDSEAGTFQAGQITPLGVQGERGYIQVVSPMQVELETVSVSDDILKLDPLELPAELQLLTAAPPLGTWQYTDRPFELSLNVNWFQPGTTVTQVVEFSEANSRISQDGELVTDVIYYVKSRGRGTLRVQLPKEPVRLWEVSVNGQVVTARQAEDATLIPLSSGTDPNVPTEVRLRLGKPTVSESNPELTLPVVLAPVLKTQWRVTGDDQYLLVPNGGTVTPPAPVTRPSGFDWVAKRGLGSLALIGFLTVFGVATRTKSGFWGIFGLIALAIAISVCVKTADTAQAEIGSPTPLEISLPILSAGDTVQLWVKNTPLWRIDLSWFGAFLLVAGIAAIAWAYTKQDVVLKGLLRWIAALLIALGVLMQGAGAPWFYTLLGVAILVMAFIRPAWKLGRDIYQSERDVWQQRRQKKRAKKQATSSKSNTDSGGAVTTAILLAALTLTNGFLSQPAHAADGFEVADSIQQDWQINHQDERLRVAATITLSGQPGDRFELLRAPAVLTQFDGKGLRLTKREIPGEGLTYIVSIPITDEMPMETTGAELLEGTTPTDEKPADAEPSDSEPNDADHGVHQRAEYSASFEYQLEAIKTLQGVPVLTGTAGVQRIELSCDEAGWDVISPTAVRVESRQTETDMTKAIILLRPGNASVMLKPQARDVTSEKTQFFVEASNLYLPGPGVVDGRHRLEIRPSQGEVSELDVTVPTGRTVSQVEGPVGSWQFDAESGVLKLEIEPSQSTAFNVLIETQRGLDPLPADVDLAPLEVANANGQVGLVAIAFGPDSQPEKLESEQMSAVNLRDFDSSLLPNQQAVLHRVYRYGADSGSLALRVAPVEPEVRVISKQVISLGDERLVAGVNFAVEISRAGLFQLSFPLPDGLEVESLTGASLHHWSELTEGDVRQIILHLNGKTIGSQTFSLTLSGNAPENVAEWQVPRFEMNEAARQSGELVIQPTTGIRLRTVSRENVSETDPRSMGGEEQGALAFRLLQRGWNLVVGIEKLDPWVTGQVLHEMNLREGQTRSALLANFQVKNASIRSLRVILPIAGQDEIKTLRASGDSVSDLIRTAPDSNIWEVQFKNRVVGEVQFQIEYERREDRNDEQVSPARFPQARQLAYYFAIRAGGRLELETDSMTAGWQRVDWNAVPQKLRNSGNQNAPTLALRAVTPAQPLAILVKRHSLADTLRLRVANGTLTSVLSPSGNQLTSVDLKMEVIQRSSLSVGLPRGGELFNVFVNGESVNSIRLDGDGNTWQFYILPGIEDRTASVRFVYSVPGSRLTSLQLGSPQLNVPLENIRWNVIAPKGYELTDDDGNLELVSSSKYRKEYDRDRYLSKASGKRSDKAQQTEELWEQANQWRQEGEQFKARWALNSVANQGALDAASNEDARVQLEDLLTDQVIHGLNARRQRLYLDNRSADAEMAENEQLMKAAAVNPILQQDELNFRPEQLSDLLQGNSAEYIDFLRTIAGRLVQHQHTTEPAPQAIIISLPEEGTTYTFSRSLQVAENAPLELELDFARTLRLYLWQVTVVLALLAILAAVLSFVATAKNE